MRFPNVRSNYPCFPVYFTLPDASRPFLAPIVRDARRLGHAGACTFALGHLSTGSGDSGSAHAMFFAPLSLGFAAPTGPLAASGLCDIAAAAGNPCVAAHSTVRAMYSSYSGALYQVQRSDNSTMDVKVLTQGGYVDAKAQDTFCGAGACVISSIYDQSPMGNHLAIAPPGGAHEKRDAPVNATADPLTIGGHRAYSAYFEGGMGYRRDRTSGIAKGDEARTVLIQP